MNELIAPTVQTYVLNGTLFERALTGLDRGQLLARCGPSSNPMLWIAGHVTLIRCSLANLLGVQRERPWESLFSRGARLAADSDYPDVAEIQAVWASVTRDLMERFDALTVAELAAPSPRRFPLPDSSIRGAITFLSSHEAYHVGQMGFIRKWLGLGGLLDG